MAQTNEWSWTADVKSHIDALAASRPNLPFSGAKVEAPSSGVRRDLTLLDRSNRPVLTGEIKLPYRSDGLSPQLDSVVLNAVRKARDAKCEYFFTWNVNEFVLWRTFPDGTLRSQREYRVFNVLPTMPVRDENHLMQAATRDTINGWLDKFITLFAGLLHDPESLSQKQPGDAFVDFLESSLAQPILFTFDALQARYTDSRFRREFDEWARVTQAWIVSTDPEAIRQAHENAAKYACYVLVNKLVFYEVLLKRHAGNLQKIQIASSVRTADELRTRLEYYFAKARDVTHDYQTVFGADHRELGSRIPFYSDASVAHWRGIVDEIHQFDFSALDYEVIGSIFERLISPEERRKHGQFYTRVEVVDLINSFCMRTGGESVLDPACGGGTFLVRAYARQRDLQPGLDHSRRLSHLYGVDRSDFAAHLTTINLAVRDLVDAANFPRVRRSDFFDVLPQNPFVELPDALPGPSPAPMIQVPLKQVDTVVGNPPYVVYKDVPRREAYSRLVSKEWPGYKPHATSDLYVYFWLHAARLLQQGGRIGFLTANQWLDVEYGHTLQRWMLDNFKVEALIQSDVEPWFDAARVNTVVTTLVREQNQAARAANIVRFVRLHRALSEIVVSDGTTAGLLQAVDGFRDRIMATTVDFSDEDMTIVVVRQSGLYAAGVETGRVLRASGQLKGKSEPGSYWGSRWGEHLRTVPVLSSLISETGSRWCFLVERTKVSRGLTTGADDFFYLRDRTEETLRLSPNEIMAAVGVDRGELTSGRLRVVESGKELHLVEPEYLRPLFKTPRGHIRFQVQNSDTTHHVLWVNRQKPDLSRTHVAEYIAWGERNNFNLAEMCKQRAASGRNWYDVTKEGIGEIFLSKRIQYRHVVPLNRGSLCGNQSSYLISPGPGVDAQLYAAILNSTWALLSLLQASHPVGTEATLEVTVRDAELLRIPDPNFADDRVKTKLIDAFTDMSSREALYFVAEARRRKDSVSATRDDTEVGQLDRRALDEAVLELLGITDAAIRGELIDSAYEQIDAAFDAARGKEETSIINKQTAGRRQSKTPRVVAAELVARLKSDAPDAVKSYDADLLGFCEDWNSFELPAMGVPRLAGDLMEGQGVEFTHGLRRVGFVAAADEQLDLLYDLAVAGIRGIVRIPADPEACRQTRARLDTYLNERDSRVAEMADYMVADEDTRARVIAAASRLLLTDLLRKA